MDTDTSARQAIVDAMRELVRLGLNRGTAGNVSRRCEGGFYISPTGVPCEHLSADQVVRMRWDGTAQGDWLPSSEWQLHRDLLIARPELNAVVHTHAPQSTAVAILGHELPAVHYMVATAGGPSVRCARYATFGSAGLGAAVVDAMRGRRACLMAHHGAIAAHADLPRAIALAATVEELAGLYLAVLPFGAPPVLSDDEIVRVMERFETYGQPRSA